MSVSNIEIRTLDPKTEEEESILKAQEVFKISFSTSYRKLANRNEEAKQAIIESGQDSDFETALSNFLDAAFEDEIDAYNGTKHNIEGDEKTLFYAVYNSEKEMIGYLGVDISNEGKTTYLRQMAIHPEYAGQGIGTKLLDHVILQHPNVENIDCATRHWNIPAINFYKRLGYKAEPEAAHGLNPDRYIGLRQDTRPRRLQLEYSTATAQRLPNTTGEATSTANRNRNVPRTSTMSI